MSRLPTSDQRTLPKPSSNGSRIQLQRTNLPSPKKSTNPKPPNSTLEKKPNGVSGLKPPSGISKIGKCHAYAMHLTPRVTTLGIKCFNDS